MIVFLLVQCRSCDLRGTGVVRHAYQLGQNPHEQTTHPQGSCHSATTGSIFSLKEEMLLRDRVRGRRCAEKNLAGFPVTRNLTISLSFSVIGPCCICSRSLRNDRSRRLRETANLCAFSKLIATSIGR